MRVRDYPTVTLRLSPDDKLVLMAVSQILHKRPSDTVAFVLDHFLFAMSKQEGETYREKVEMKMAQLRRAERSIERIVPDVGR